MNEEQKLAFGIEIVAAMKASARNTTIETGRILALENTEIDRYEEWTKEEIENLSDEMKAHVMKVINQEKKRLHKQAMFAANAAIEFMQTKISDYLQF